MTTVINVVSTLINVAADATESGVVDTFGDLKTKLDTAEASIDNVKETVDSFGNIIAVSKGLNDIVNDNNISEILDKTNGLIDSGTDMTKLLQNSINGITSSVDSTLESITDGLDETADTIASVSNKAAEDAKQPIQDVQTKLTKFSAQLEAIKETLETVKSFLPVELPAIDKLLTKVNSRITAIDKLLGRINKLQDGSATKEIYAITGDINQLSEDITLMQSDYKRDVKPVVDDNLNAVLDLLSITGELVTDLNGDLPALKTLTDSLNKTADSGEELIASIDTLLTNIKKQIKALSGKIDGLEDSEIFNTIKNVSSKNTDQLGAFLACPVIVNTDKVYGIENYGSAMAPFYSTLAIWVGAMVLIAVVKTAVKKKKEIGNVRIYQSYFGRMLTFLAFSVTQALIICLGDLYFLKIQCYHPAKFILAGVVAAVAFTVFVYSLGFTFGDIGKAIGIIFLVIQIGGSGGTFPIDVTPNFFQVLNPYMPFTFVINAMRECVCGTYGNDYWIDLLKLSAYIGVGLVIGLGVKFLVKKPVRFFEKRIEKTGLF